MYGSSAGTRSSSRRRRVGRGSWDNGGNVASVGHLYGFGNTLDKALTGVVGCKERGRQQVDGPLDHSTGISEPWSDSLTANPGQRLTVPDSLTALTALSLTV